MWHDDRIGHGGAKGAAEAPGTDAMQTGKSTERDTRSDGAGHGSCLRLKAGRTFLE
jgi:hypothetical protein